MVIFSLAPVQRVPSLLYSPFHFTFLYICHLMYIVLIRLKSREKYYHECAICLTANARNMMMDVLDVRDSLSIVCLLIRCEIENRYTDLI